MGAQLQLSAWLVVLVLATPVAAQKRTYESEPVTRTATITAIDTANRVVTVKNAAGETFEIEAPVQMQGFNTLKVGDQVSATYFEAAVIQIRRPGEPAPSTEPATTTVRKDRVPGSETRRQQTISGTIEAIDVKAPSVKVKGPQGGSVTVTVADPAQLQKLNVGDAIDVTYYQSLLVKVAPPPKK